MHHKAEGYLFTTTLQRHLWHARISAEFEWVSIGWKPQIPTYAWFFHDGRRNVIGSGLARAAEGRCRDATCEIMRANVACLDHRVCRNASMPSGKRQSRRKDLLRPTFSSFGHDDLRLP